MTMTYSEIVEAVDAGLIVHWGNSLYVVIDGGKSSCEYLVQCALNGSCIGLGSAESVEPDYYFLAGDRAGEARAATAANAWRTE
jgi:hypothetical protein